MYLVEGGRNNGKIWKIPAGENDIPGPEDTPELIISNLAYPQCLTTDGIAYIYLCEESGRVIDGFSSYVSYDILKMDISTHSIQPFFEGLNNPTSIVYRDTSLYITDLFTSAIYKIDTLSGERTNITQDYGVSVPQGMAFDSDDRLYTVDFRRHKLFRLLGNGIFEAVGQGIGYAQTIVSDGQYFYTGSADMATSNGSQILRIDPFTGLTKVVGTHYQGFRQVALDSYGRLILNENMGSNEFRLSIINVYTGEATPYVIGLTSEKGVQFDPNQNLYVTALYGGIYQGIKKIYLEENYDPPRDISSEPLFYDFASEPFPPSIGFFHVNHLEEVFIPRHETGDVLMGDKFGNLEVFAEGFNFPNHVTFDQYGRMHLIDLGNGIFKITKLEWSVPLISEKLEAFIQEIRQIQLEATAAVHIDEKSSSSGETGIINSICQKLEGAIRSLQKGHLNASINVLEALQNQISALRGKKIPEDFADRWLKSLSQIIGVLVDLRD